MRLATIDIGTNTILLLIVEVRSGSIVNILHDEQVIARLGKGVDADRIINRETFIRAEGFLQQYKATCDARGVDLIRAVGTSALRDAGNREEFISYIAEKTGISIEILSGDDEAHWTFRGGISEFSGKAELFSVIDIGGGSTEIVVGDEQTLHSKTSVDLGCVRLTERILQTSPPDIECVAEAHAFIADHFPRTLAEIIPRTFAVGVAGTVTTLAALHQQLPQYQPEKVSGSSLAMEDIGLIFGQLQNKSIDQIARIPQISPGRADILLAGIMILMGYMEAAGLRNITVSDRGLRYGIVYREIERMSLKE